MPRLSLWKDGQHSLDYKFFDRRISEMFTVGGTGILVHKYLGTKNQGVDDYTQPQYANAGEKNIQDLLFLENRDRIYDTTVYTMRGIYQVSDNDFDLTQFGLFLSTGTLFMTFHINDMIDILGRRIVSGDVLELMHLKDYDALNDVPLALKRFFVVGDCQRASEGFSPSWWPHLWRCKINPLVDSQEYKDILDKIQTGADGQDYSLREVISTYNTYNNINDAIIEQAEVDVPLSGYDTSGIFVQPLDERGGAAASKTLTADDGSLDSNIGIDASDLVTADLALISPDAKVQGWLTGDGTPPNNFPVNSGISFPANPSKGDFCLRLDYMPNRLFRFDGRRWVKIEDRVRTSLTPGSENNTLKSSFVNNAYTFTDPTGAPQDERQSLSQALKPKADNQ